MSRDLHIEDKVTFTGSVTHEMLPLFYGAADVCVIPSYYESFGMVALESLACGTPIVTTDVGGMRNIVHSDEIGYIVSNNYPHQLASRISDILSLNGQGEKRAKSRREAAEKFAWSNIADRLLEEYQKVLYPQIVNQ
jgi:D-inositol-3-phosphate glycosyltransferase